MTNQAIPHGWKLVPAEMTLDMSIAFAEAWYSKSRAIDDSEMQDAYAAMLAAAPGQPASDTYQLPAEGLPNLPQLLRENADLDAAEGGNPDVVALECAAADEIERLRREVSSLRASVGDERAAFEASYRERYRVAAHVPLTYPDVPAAWEWWQARAALASAPVAGEALSELVELAEELGDLASDMVYEANQEMDQEKASRGLLIERGERALRQCLHAEPQASTAADARDALDADRLRQWFDCLQDTQGGWLTKEDYVLAQCLYAQCGMRVPNSIAAIAAQQGKGGEV
ncbi:hypothetical protein C0J09_11090 [Bordetella avium]|uniref:hypothetical protein n=1 Tax=Bordetella avium TaxID=521 RepID=UPI000FD87496|nr:hypothetical protein [Bordetella avium]AZY49621.1 hypothetical protein C0J09_11090 [Bordetella avium]